MPKRFKRKGGNCILGGLLQPNCLVVSGSSQIVLDLRSGLRRQLPSKAATCREVQGWHEKRKKVFSASLTANAPFGPASEVTSKSGAAG